MVSAYCPCDLGELFMLSGPADASEARFSSNASAAARPKTPAAPGTPTASDMPTGNAQQAAPPPRVRRLLHRRGPAVIITRWFGRHHNSTTAGVNGISITATARKGPARTAADASASPARYLFPNKTLMHKVRDHALRWRHAPMPFATEWHAASGFVAG